jgi:hypothetical protein
MSLLVGTFMAYFIIKQYEALPAITVSGKALKIYYVQRGVYSDLENMKNNMKDFTNYIYDVEDGKYFTYIGITISKENALKIQAYYKKSGYDTYIKEKVTDNNNLTSMLKQYDSLLEKTSDDEAIKVICNQVLANSRR